VADAGISLRQALSAIASRLQDAGIDRGRAEARLLAAEAIGISVETVVGNDARLLSETEQQALDDLASRRVRREPMSQILGYREFYGRRFAVTADVLTPPAYAKQIAKAIPDARLELVPDAGHMLMLERTDTLDQLIVDFAREVGVKP